MRRKFLELIFILVTFGLVSCTNVDKNVAEAPSKYWKSPKEGLPSEYISPERIKTDKIVSKGDKASSKDDKVVNRDAKISSDKVLKKTIISEDVLIPSDKISKGIPLCLYDLVDIALENNPTTRQYWFQAKVAAARKGKADSAYMPYISVSADIYRSRKKQVSTINFPGAIGTYYDTGYGPTLQMNWLLFDFGKREALASAAKENLMTANFEYNQSLQDVVLNVYKAYYDLYASKGSVRAAEENLKDAKTTYDSATERLNNNVGNRQDMLRALANEKNAEFNLEKAKSYVEEARAKLAIVLGIRVSENLNISYDNMTVVESKDVTKKIDELIKMALNDRQDILAAYASLRSSQESTNVSKRSFLPSISGVGTAQRGYYLTDNYYGTPSENLTIGLNFSWDIFTGFSRYYDLISAKAQERAAAQVLKQTEINVISNVWAYYYVYQSSLKQVESTRAAAEASEEAYKATKIGYENGVSSLTDLLNAQSLLAVAREQKVLADANLGVSIASLAHSIGNIQTNISTDEKR